MIFQILFIQTIVLFIIALSITILSFVKKDILLSPEGKTTLMNEFGKLKMGVGLTVSAVFLFFAFELLEFGEELFQIGLLPDFALLDYFKVFYLFIYMFGLLYFLSILKEV